MTQNKHTESTFPERQPIWDSLSKKSGPLLIAGGEGMLGKALARACRRRGLSYVALGRKHFDITDPAAVTSTLEKYRPAAVVNAAGFADVARAESQVRRCCRENLVGPLLLSRACSRSAIPLVLFSSAMVFNGVKEHGRRPFREEDTPQPVGVYARSKALMEQFIRNRMPDALILRTSAMFGPFENQSFVTTALRSLACGQSVSAAADAYLTPVYLPDLCDRTLEMVVVGATGIRHLAHPEPVSRLGMIARAATLIGIGTQRLHALPARVQEAADVSAVPPLSLIRSPAWAVLGSEHSTALPPLDQALQRLTAGDTNRFRSESRWIFAEETDS